MLVALLPALVLIAVVVVMDSGHQPSIDRDRQADNWAGLTF
jgi:hypothetical protein